MTELLDADFLRRLRALRHHLLSEARSGASADRISPRRGASAEFREHRPYVAGDDLRRVDWMAFARTGEPVIKLFHAEEDTLVRLLIDASASLQFGSPPKIDAVRRMAAALAYLALSSSRRAQVVVGTTSAEGPSLAVGSPQQGQRGFFRICEELTRVQPKGALALADSIDRVVRRFSRPGLLVVLSDFLDPSPIPDALRRARAAGHDVAVIQVLDPSELEPNFQGDLSLEDAETGEQVEVTMDAAALEAYALGLAGLLEELRRWARQNGSTYVRMRSTDELENAVRRVLAKAVD